MPFPFTVRFSDGWGDITDEVESIDPPWTLAKLDGVGALQFSVATYNDGQAPDPSPEILLSMLRDFASSHGLGDLGDIVTEQAELRIAAASFRLGDDFIRVWYASDGRNFAKATYTCVWGVHQTELPDCERMIKTLRMENGKRQG